MKTPWHESPLVISAIPIFGSLTQIIILSFITMFDEDGVRWHQISGFLLFIFAMLLPVISIPSLYYAIKIIRKNGMSFMNILRCILNGAYVLVLAFDLLVLSGPLILHATK